MTGGQSVLQQQIHILYQDHHGWLYQWLHRKLGNRFDAADLAQDTFMRVLAGYRQEMIPVLDEPRAYLTTVAKRLLINFYARQSLVRGIGGSLCLLPTQHGPGPARRAVVLGTFRGLAALLDAFPARVRTAFLVCPLGGMSYEQLAAHLQVSVRTVARYI